MRELASGSIVSRQLKVRYDGHGSPRAIVRPPVVWFGLVPSRFIDIDMPEEFVLECLTPEGNWIE